MTNKQTMNGTTTINGGNEMKNRNLVSNNIDNMSKQTLDKLTELSNELSQFVGINFQSNNMFMHQNHTNAAELKNMFEEECNMMVLVNKQENITNIIYADGLEYYYKSFKNGVVQYEEKLKDRKEANEIIDSFYDQLQWDDFYIINGILYETRTISVNAKKTRTYETIVVEDKWEEVVSSYNSGRRIKYTDGETTTIVVGNLISVYMYGRLISERNMLKSICLDKIRQMYDLNKCKWISTLEY